MTIKTPQRKKVNLASGGTQSPKTDRLIKRFCKGYLGFDIQELITSWRLAFSRIAKHEGELQAVKIAKEWYTVSLRKAAGATFSPLPFRKSDNEGFPKDLSFVKPWLTDSNLQRRRAALTVLQLYKLQDVRGVYSLQSITAPMTGKFPDKFMKEYSLVLRRMFPPEKLGERIYSLKHGFHVSGRNGPNGPMLGTAGVDREAIRNSSVERHVESLSRSTQDFNLQGLLAQTKRPCEVIHKSGRKASHSRIRIKYEPGAKCRPFAIVDFFTQSALKPIHIFLMDWLRKQKQDGSDSHSDAAKAVQEWTGQQVPTWSFDLTAATDRWPIQLIYLAMEAALGQEIAEGWRDLIANRTFEGPSGEEVRWEVGQPLGALSSWAAFAVSHHAFIQTCERLDWLEERALAPRKRFRFRKPVEYYRMIGDDITIARYSNIAALYHRYLLEFGLEISVSKSILPEQCAPGQFIAELAKRVYVNGKEVTPLPPDAIIEFSKPYGIRALLESSLERGYLGAGSPYPVQSAGLSLNQWSLLTFPIRNVLPQLNGVKQLFPFWKIGTDPGPAGLNPNWFFWNSIPEEDLRQFFNDYVIEEARKAEVESVTLIRSLSFTMGPTSPLSKLPQGGDWKPSPAECHPQIILTVLREISQVLAMVQMTWYDPDLTVEDLYKEIGRLHVFLEPRLLVQGRKYLDQKKETRLFMSKAVKYCIRRAKDKS